MANLRISKAKYQYTCNKCSSTIQRGRLYYRLEPYPIARIKGLEKVEHFCVDCVNPKAAEETRESLRNYWFRDWPQKIPAEQLDLLSEDSITVVETRVHVPNITPEILRLLSTNPNELYNLTPDLFEELICDRLRTMGFGIERVGGHSFRKDGGIDIIAWSENSHIPFLMAIQVKHHGSPNRKTGPAPIRELLGVVQNHSFNAGLLVTNTTFTPDAKWIAEQRPMLVRLRDIHDIQRWLIDNFLDEYEWREIPNEIVLCPGVIVSLPKSRTWRK